MITLKQFRKAPINNDPRGIPIFVQHGMHSIPKLNEAKNEWSKPIEPNYTDEKQVSDYYFNQDQQSGSTKDWAPDFDFSKEPSYAKSGKGHPYQLGRARDLQQLPTTFSVSNSFREDFKLDNAHLSPHKPEDEAENHIYAHHKFLSKHYHDDAISDEIYDYTQDSSQLNRYLVKSHLEGKDVAKTAAEGGDDESFERGGIDIANLDRALAEKELPAPLTVYSGIKFNAGLRAAKNTYNRVVMPGYLSSSIDVDQATGFSRNLVRGTEAESSGYSAAPIDRHYLRIHLPEGFGGYYIGHRSQHDHEREFLIPRMTSLQIMPNPRIIKARRNYDGPFSTAYHHFWDAHPVKP